jgi:SSS family solute:Na+ symporter
LAFGLLNTGIVASYIIFTLITGFVLSKKITTDQHFYLGNKTTPWWAIGLSVVATYFGALTFLGGPAWAYQEGLSVILIHINYPIVVFIVASVFLPFFYNSGVASIYDYLESRFGKSTRLLMAGVFLFGNLAYSGIMLYTTALVLEFIIGIDVTTAILVVATIAMAYTILGGMSAVIWTDVAQSFLLLIGIIVIIVLLITELPDGLFGTLSQLKASGKTSPYNFSFEPDKVATIWTGVIAMTIYHVVVYGVNQMMVQRTLAAQNIGDAKKAYYLMGYSAFFIFMLFFTCGILLNGYYADRAFENGNTIMLQFASDAAIPGLMGVITAAVIAASMSSLDSSLNSMATVTTLDFYKLLLKPDESPSHYLKFTRLATLGWGIIIIIPAILFIDSSGSVLEILSKIGSFLVGAKLSCYVLGFYSKHTTEKGLLVGVAAGFLSLWYADSFLSIAWPWYCAIGGGVSLLVGWLASLCISGRQTEHHPFSIVGQRINFEITGRDIKESGWYLLPGKVDKGSYGLLVFFVASLLMLFFIEFSI